MGRARWKYLKTMNFSHEEPTRETYATTYTRFQRFVPRSRQKYWLKELLTCEIQQLVIWKYIRNVNLTGGKRCIVFRKFGQFKVTEMLRTSLSRQPYLTPYHLLGKQILCNTPYSLVIFLCSKCSRDVSVNNISSRLVQQFYEVNRSYGECIECANRKGQKNRPCVGHVLETVQYRLESYIWHQLVVAIQWGQNVLLSLYSLTAKFQ